MPLVKGEKSCSNKGKSENISTEVGSGRPRNEAMAIAFEACLRSDKKKAKR